MPGGVCKTIICGGPWAAVEQAGDKLLASDGLTDQVKKQVNVVCENAASNWRLTQELAIDADEATADAVDQWARKGAKASVDLLLTLTEGV